MDKRELYLINNLILYQKIFNLLFDYLLLSLRRHLIISWLHETLDCLRSRFQTIYILFGRAHLILISFSSSDDYFSLLTQSNIYIYILNLNILQTSNDNKQTRRETKSPITLVCYCFCCCCWGFCWNFSFFILI